MEEQNLEESKEGAGKTPSKKRVGIIAASIAALALVVYVGLGFYFQTHFAFGTTINGISVSGATVNDVKNIISESAKGYRIEITENGEVLDVITASEIDVQSNPDDGEVEQFLASQNGFEWPVKLFNVDHFMGSRIVSFDNSKLHKVVRNLSSLDRKDSVKTENATYELKGNEFVIIDEVYGTELDEKDLAPKLGEEIKLFKRKVDLKDDNLYVMPQVTKDSEELKNLVADLNKTLNVKITYKDAETISRDDIASFIAPGSRGIIRFDEDAVEEYVVGLAKKYNTIGKPKTLKTSYGTTVTVPGGTYGWRIDVDKEKETLMENLLAGEDVERDFEYMYRAATHGDADYGDSYIEVNLSSQELFLYVDGKKILESAFVSGNTSRGLGTHTGAYFIAYCQKNAILRGPGYATPVSYWMPFFNGEGLHDAVWRSSFGGNIYKTNGSHGCLNLPYSVAQKIFANVEAGFPVLIYADGTYSRGVVPANEKTPEQIEEESINSLIATINTLTNVTLADEATVVSARSTYNTLSEEGKAKVTNIGILTQAEAVIAYQKSAQNNPLPPVDPNPTPEPVPDPETPVEPATPDVVPENNTEADQVI